MLFCANLEGRLGLFHLLLYRIVDTLDPKCGLDWKGLAGLKIWACKRLNVGLLSILNWRIVASQVRALFNSNSKKIAEEQTKKLQWVQDPNNNMERYIGRYRQGKVDASAPKMAVQPPRFWPWEVAWVSRSSHKHGGRKVACWCAYLRWNSWSQWNSKVKRTSQGEEVVMKKEINWTLEYSEEPEFFDHPYLSWTI